MNVKSNSLGKGTLHIQFESQQELNRILTKLPVKNKIAVFAFVLGLLSLNSATAQQIQKDTLSRKERLIADPLTPSKAAFYSAVLPGLGQLYLGKAWKVPLRMPP